MTAVVVGEALTDRLDGLQAEFMALCRDFESAPALLSTRDVLSVAESVERLSRRVEYAQLVVAHALDSRVIDTRELEPGTRRETPDYRSAAEVLRSRLRISRAESKRRVELAQLTVDRRSLTGESIPAKYRKLGSLLAVGTAGSQAICFAAKALELASVKVASNVAFNPQLGNVAELLQKMESSVLGALEKHDPEFAGAVLKRWDAIIDQDGKRPSEQELRQRQGIVRRRQYRGLAHFEIWADGKQAETLLTVMNAGSNPRAALADAVSGAERRSRPQQQLDSVIAALGSALRYADLPMAGGRAPQLSVLIDYRQLQTDLSRRAGNAAAEFAGPVPAAMLRSLACEADLIPVVLGGAGEVLDAGRRQRLFSRSQRSVLVARDRGCSFPECTIPASWTEAHHVEWWSHGGPTSVENGALLCSRHHHVIHQGDWQMEIREGVPVCIPPPWIDPERKVLRNEFHRI